MQDPLTPEFELVEALRLTAGPPADWIEAAALIPDTLRELDALDRVVLSPEFQRRFREDPRAAVADAGLKPTPVVMAALGERIAVAPD
jgi:hypothetical protein